MKSNKTATKFNHFSKFSNDLKGNLIKRGND